MKVRLAAPTWISRPAVRMEMFYAAYGRSFHRSSDGGVTWSDRPFDGQVNDIAVDPADGNRVLVAVLEAGLFRSLDGGQTFSKIAPDVSIWAAAVGRNNVMYYATQTTFHRSTNGGDSFGAPVAVLPPSSRCRQRHGCGLCRCRRDPSSCAARTETLTGPRLRSPRLPMHLRPGESAERHPDRGDQQRSIFLGRQRGQLDLTPPGFTWTSPPIVPPPRR